MSDYYISNRTFFLSGSKIYSSEGSGSDVDKSNGVEMTKDWYMNQKINIDDLITHTMQLEDINKAFDLMH